MSSDALTYALKNASDNPESRMNWKDRDMAKFNALAEDCHWRNDDGLCRPAAKICRFEHCEFVNRGMF